MKKLLTYVLSIIMCMTLVGCAKAKDLNDYVTASFEGYNGYGTAVLDVDYDGLVDQRCVDKTIKLYEERHTEQADAILLYFKEVNDHCKKMGVVSIGVDNDGSLSNGDEAIIRAYCREDLLEILDMTEEEYFKAIGFNLKETTTKRTVEGLEDIKIIDLQPLFEDKIQWIGADGYGKAEIVFPKDYQEEYEGLYFKGNGSNYLTIINGNESFGNIYFSTYGQNNLKEGDVLNVDVSNGYDEPNTAFLNYMVDNKVTLKPQYTIDVPYLGEYITNKEQMTDEVIDALINQCKEKHDISEDNQILSVYFFKANPGVADDTDSHCGVSIFYEYMFGKIKHKGDVTLYDVWVKDGVFQGYKGKKNIYLEEDALNTQSDYTYEKVR